MSIITDIGLDDVKKGKVAVLVRYCKNKGIVNNKIINSSTRQMKINLSKKTRYSFVKTISLLENDSKEAIKAICYQAKKSLDSKAIYDKGFLALEFHA